MLIREVEERCGISKKNIRFYEQQGLLQPKRNASNYRCLLYTSFDACIKY